MSPQLTRPGKINTPRTPVVDNAIKRKEIKKTVILKTSTTHIGGITGTGKDLAIGASELSDPNYSALLTFEPKST